MIHSIREQRVLRAFHGLNSPDFAPARDFIREELNRTLDAMVTIQIDQIAQLQGRARVLKELLELVEQAGSRLNGA